MRAIIIAAVACLALAGCQTNASIDTTIQRNLPAACVTANSAYAAFTVAAASGTFSERTVVRVDQIYGTLRPLCVDPTAQNSATILFAVASLVAVIREAEQGE